MMGHQIYSPYSFYLFSSTRTDFSTSERRLDWSLSKCQVEDETSSEELRRATGDGEQFICVAWAHHGRAIYSEIMLLTGSVMPTAGHSPAFQTTSRRHIRLVGSAFHCYGPTCIYVRTLQASGRQKRNGGSDSERRWQRGRRRGITGITGITGKLPCSIYLYKKINPPRARL